VRIRSHLLLLAAERCPQVAIIDIGLPDISGYDVARRFWLSSTARLRLSR